MEQITSIYITKYKASKVRSNLEGKLGKTEEREATVLLV